MATRKAAKAAQAQSDAASTKREAAAAGPNILGKWSMKLTPHGNLGVEQSFLIFIKESPNANGVFAGGQIDAANNPIKGGELLGILLTPANIMGFKINVLGTRYALIGTVAGSPGRLKFTGVYIKLLDGVALAAEPGETGTGGGSQGT